MVSWTTENDRKLLLDLVVKNKLKPDAADVSKLLGCEVTEKALKHRLDKLRKEHADMWQALEHGGDHGTAASGRAKPARVSATANDEDDDDDVDNEGHEGMNGRADEQAVTASPTKRKRRTKAEMEVVRAEKAAKAIAKAQAKAGIAKKDTDDDDDEIAPPSPQSPVAAAKKRKVKHENGD